MTGPGLEKRVLNGSADEGTQSHKFSVDPMRDRLYIVLQSRGYPCHPVSNTMTVGRAAQPPLLLRSNRQVGMSNRDHMYSKGSCRSAEMENKPRLRGFARSRSRGSSESNNSSLQHSQQTCPQPCSKSNKPVRSWESHICETKLVSRESFATCTSATDASGTSSAMHAMGPGSVALGSTSLETTFVHVSTAGNPVQSMRLR